MMVVAPNSGSFVSYHSRDTIKAVQNIAFEFFQILFKNHIIHCSTLLVLIISLHLCQIEISVFLSLMERT